MRYTSLKEFLSEMYVVWRKAVIPSVVIIIIDGHYLRLYSLLPCSPSQDGKSSQTHPPVLWTAGKLAKRREKQSVKGASLNED
ncbi:hypothetical protein F2P79_010752 [Pimephales promelas]|nr:hypothetical protein F2P79_010752 [Pimephales promelas]